MSFKPVQSAGVQTQNGLDFSPGKAEAQAKASVTIPESGEMSWADAAAMRAAYPGKYQMPVASSGGEMAKLLPITEEQKRAKLEKFNERTKRLKETFVPMRRSWACDETF